jgi:flagellar motor switch protein FliN/FliY
VTGEPANISPFPRAQAGDPFAPADGIGGAAAMGGMAGVGSTGGMDAGARGFGANDAPVHPVRFPPLPPAEGGAGNSRPIDLIMDVSMRVSVELGRSSMTVEEILELGPGSVVELNKLAGEPVDILVNDRLIARGEVVVVDENFGVRVTEIISPRQRATAIGY